jgi:hypothetical protein
VLKGITVWSDKTYLSQKIVEKLTDQPALAYVTKNAKVPEARLWALDKLSDHALLVDVMENVEGPNSSDIRVKAAEKLGQQYLRDLAMTSQSVSERMRAAERLKDRAVTQKVYADIAENASWALDRMHAAEKLKDTSLAQKVCLDIFRKRKDYADFAVDHLIQMNAQEALADIAKTCDSTQLRIRAFKGLTTQKTLGDVAKNAENHWIRKEAVEKLTGQKTLQDVAEHAEDFRIRMEAAKKLTDQALAQQLYRDFAETPLFDADSNPLIDEDVKLEALERLEDKSLFQPAWTDVAQHASFADRALEALREITDRAVLADIAMTARYRAVQIGAVQKLKDQRALGDIAAANRDSSVRMEAAERLDDKTLAQRTYLDIMKKDTDNGVRTQIAEKLTDPECIVEAIDHLLKISGGNFHTFQPLIALAEHNPKIVASYWPKISAWARNFHYDLYGTLVNTNNDCGHDDHVGCENWLDSFPSSVRGRK